MKIIWYLMDGLSAECIESLNKNKLDYKFKTSYFDTIIDQSMTLSKVYGHGETFASLSSQLTGLTLEKLRSDNWTDYRSFNAKNTVSEYFKDTFGTYNIFYRNYSSKYPTIGVYERFNKLCTHGFDKIILSDDSRVNLNNSKVINQVNDYFEKSLETNIKNKFIFIHDLYLHDHPTAYESSDLNDYHNAIFEAGEHLKNNLEYLDFDENEDILILSSDHGLTIRPQLDMFTKFDTNLNEYLSYRNSLYSELKLRAFLSIYSKSINPMIFEEPILMKDTNKIIKDILTSIIFKKPLDDFRKEYFSENIMTSVADLAYGNPISIELRRTIHSHLIYYSNKDKYVYTHWPKKKVYRFLNDDYVEIEYSELPMNFKKQIKKYYSIFNRIKRSKWIILEFKLFLKRMILK